MVRCVACHVQILDVCHCHFLGSVQSIPESPSPGADLIGRMHSASSLALGDTLIDQSVTGLPLAGNACMTAHVTACT